MHVKEVCALLVVWLAVARSAPSVRCLVRKVDRSTPEWSMDCSSLNLTDFPRSVSFYPVLNLTMSKNKIQSPLQLSNWTELRYLDLSYNQINNLSNFVFQKMEHLLYLNLSHNTLNSIGDNTFSNLSSLQVLDVSSNPDLGRKCYYCLQSFKKMLADGLKELHMSSVYISHIPIDMFDNAKNLQVLDLSRNYLKELPIFPPSLIHLDLSGNLLEKIRFLPFSRSENLQMLSLNNNTELADIESGAFQNLDNLATLAIKGCMKLKTQILVELKDIADSTNSSNVGSITTNSQNNTYVLNLKLDKMELNIDPLKNRYINKWFAKVYVKASGQYGSSNPPKETGIAFFQVKMSHNVIRYGLILVTFIAFVMVPMSIWFAVKMERKRREDKPELKIEKVPLYDPYYSDMPPQHSSSVYVTTTRSA